MIMNTFNVKKVIACVVMLYGLIAHAADYTPLVVEGAKWVFYESNIDWSDRYMDEFHFCTGEIAGDSIVDGVAYKKYYRYATKTRSATPVALLREADRVVYCRFLTPDERYEHSWNRNGEEYIIYNFNNMNGVYKTQSKVPTLSGTVDVDGQPLAIYSNAAGRIIEGIGIDAPTWGDVVTPFIEIPLQGKVTSWGLAKVEKDGNEIYRGTCHDQLSHRSMVSYLNEGYRWHYVMGNVNHRWLYTLEFEKTDVGTRYNCYYVEGGTLARRQEPVAYVHSFGWNLMAKINHYNWYEDDYYLMNVPYDEYIVYDFSNCWAIDVWADYGSPYEYERTSEVEIEGVNRACFILSNNGKLIDGLGIDGPSGSLLIPFARPVQWLMEGTLGLSHVTDAEGRIIYKGSAYHVRGDVNGDEIVDVTDVSDLIKVVLDNRGDDAQINNQAYKWGDLNHDRMIDVTDLTVMLNIILGKSEDNKN